MSEKNNNLEMESAYMAQDLNYENYSFAPSDFETVGIQEKEAENIVDKSISFWTEVVYRFKKNKIAVIGFFILVILVLMAIFAPIISGGSYTEQNLMNTNAPASAKHWFGTDVLGRDIFTRVWYGARVSLSIGLIAAIVDIIIGVIYGSIAGIKGGKIDNIMMRAADLLSGIPYLLVVILLMTVMKQGIIPMVLALTLTGWINMARIVRGEVLSAKTNEYILASRVMGAKTGYIIRKHLLPNMLGPIIVTMMLTVPGAIFAEAFLSYLGLGIQVPFPSWGTMATDAKAVFTLYPIQLIAPGGLICLTIFAFNAVGDGLRDALDPKQRS